MRINREITLALVLAAAALAVGSATGAMGWSFFAGAVIWIALQYQQFRKISKWARKPISQPPNASEAWFNLAIQPHRALQQQRTRSKIFLTRMREVISLVEVIPDATIILNSAGEIEAFNVAAQRLLNLKTTDTGISLAAVVRSPDFVSFIRSQSEDDGLLEFASPFDADKTLEVRKFTVEQNRAVVIIRDTTELNRLLTMRQSFIANVSHELRTPLTVVTGYLETITDDEQPTDLRLGLVERLASPLTRIRSLVDDLLLLTRLESTPVPAQLDTIAMPQVIASAVHEVQGLAQRPDQITVECTTDQRILGVETEIYSVCVNLLSNALRYSDNGTPVKISWRSVGDKVELKVSDQGVGIAPEHISRLTERFYRVDMADSRKRGGTGLGLAIVKHVLRRHDSELQVESVLGEGSQFFCEFSPAPGPEPASVTGPAATARHDQPGEVQP